jgi:hypothetical protein
MAVSPGQAATRILAPLGAIWPGIIREWGHIASASAGRYTSQTATMGYNSRPGGSLAARITEELP